MEYFSVIGGLILLVIAGDKLVDGSVAIAERLNISKLVIGITVVSFGTSAPELVVGIDAALSGAVEIALGNVVGSNIANVLLVLGIPALFYPFACDDDEIQHSLFYMMLATFLFILLAYFGPIYIWQGMVMITLLVIFLFYAVRRARSNIKILQHDIDFAERALEDTEQQSDKVTSLTRSITGIFLGLAGLVFGAHLLVDGAVIIARTVGISEAVIGLSIVAIGTSLPELVTSLIAARNNHGDVAMGNIIGSNLFNILAIMGITSLVAPITIPEQFFRVDFPILVVTSLMLIPLAMGKIKINRLTGIVFSTMYILYLVFLGTQSHIFA
ncbi:MAG: calcium/sodium antiporter [Emcibacter sp.]|nr:calcium/sodium antiporter [Emcibacter sp.]